MASTVGSDKPRSFRRLRLTNSSRDTALASRVAEEDGVGFVVTAFDGDL
jgi:hypothetical protein